MSGTNSHRLAASLRRLGGRQNRSDFHLSDINTGPEQLEGEHAVRFKVCYLRRSFVPTICLPALSDAIASTETRD